MLKKNPFSEKNCYAGFLIASFCFALHLILIVHHTYVDASEHNSLQFPLSPDSILQPQRWHNFLDLNRWDAVHYETIVQQGYGSHHDQSQPSYTLMWYPGYPLVAKLIHAITDWQISAIFSLLSAVCTYVFWILLWSVKLRSAFTDKVISISSVLFLSWPYSFFWFAGMTEPLVGLLLILLLFYWVQQRDNCTIAVLAYATSVKQLFVPISLAVLLLQGLKDFPKLSPTLIKTPLALAGFLAFGCYSWLNFENFFMSSDLTMFIYKRNVSLISLIDFNNYARAFKRPGGFFAILSIIFLLLVSYRLARDCTSWKQLRHFLHHPQSRYSLELILWWLATSFTVLCILGDAYNTPPFTSILRYQTPNISLFLLLAIQLRNLAWWKVVALLAPYVSFALYYQNQMTVKYWLWEWVA